jgi:hypothetical protein
LDFCLIASVQKNGSGIFKNIITVQSHPVPVKKLSHHIFKVAKCHFLRFIQRRKNADSSYPEACTESMSEIGFLPHLILFKRMGAKS